MAVPRNRTSHAKKNSRRSHHAKKPLNFIICKNCKSNHLPHHVCIQCGHYKSKQYITKHE